MGAAVFRDDTAPAHQRYKCMFMGKTGQVPGLQDLPRPGTPIDPMTRHHGQTGIFAATSPDGLGWTVHDKPIAWHFADTGSVAQWDPDLQRLRLVHPRLELGPPHHRPRRNHRLS